VPQLRSESGTLSELRDTVAGRRRGSEEWFPFAAATLIGALWLAGAVIAVCRGHADIDSAMSGGIGFAILALTSFCWRRSRQARANSAVVEEPVA
jgi:hypothetical protein